MQTYSIRFAIPHQPIRKKTAWCKRKREGKARRGSTGGGTEGGERRERRAWGGCGREDSKERRREIRRGEGRGEGRGVGGREWRRKVLSAWHVLDLYNEMV